MTRAYRYARALIHLPFELPVPAQPQKQNVDDIIESAVQIEQTQPLNIEYSLQYLQEITIPHAWSRQPPNQNANFAISLNDIKFGYTDPGSRPSSNAKSAESVGGYPSPSCTSKSIHAAVTISRQPRNDALSSIDRSLMRESKTLKDLFHESYSTVVSLSSSERVRQRCTPSNTSRYVYPSALTSRVRCPSRSNDESQIPSIRGFEFGSSPLTRSHSSARCAKQATQLLCMISAPCLSPISRNRRWCRRRV